MWGDMCLCGCFILLDTNQSVISGLRTGDMAEYVMKRKRGSTYCAADHRGFPLGLIKSMFVLIHDNQTLCIKKAPFQRFSSYEQTKQEFAANVLTNTAIPVWDAAS